MLFFILFPFISRPANFVIIFQNPNFFKYFFKKIGGGNLLIIYHLIHNTIRMILLYLNQSAHIIDQICESDVESRPQDTHSSEKQSPHALFHETIDMFDAAACLRLDTVVFFLFFCKRLVSVSFFYYQRGQTF